MGASRGTMSGLHELLRARRLEAGLTQEQLAEMSGLSVRAISDIERGRTTRPRRSSVAMLEAALDQVGAEGLNLGVPGRPAIPRHGDPVPLSAVPRQLPQTARPFVGRERELGVLTGLLPGPEAAGGTSVVCAIAGTAGAGKTALALRWAHDVADGFPDGQLFVNLRGEIYEQARAHNGLAASHHATGDTDQALRHWRQALALYTRLGAPEANEIRAQLARSAKVLGPAELPARTG